eukprot:TRINITY_DN3631_c0_g1_i26.p1 TRINITY_DN3631_c0_g1~~TRINITY_DN3631_c0_g1_i26.p1  ORF type:complete len:118 (-),score=30.66 TRINITY_DN3631_c0_g1_i26:529-882(-)
MESTPKKPLTPFFLFRDRVKNDGITMGGKEAGDRWKSMTEEEKRPFIEEYQRDREKYDAYLESEGITPRKSSARKSNAPFVYKGIRIRSVLGMIEDIKTLHLKQCTALGKVAVWFKF